MKENNNNTALIEYSLQYYFNGIDGLNNKFKSINNNKLGELISDYDKFESVFILNNSSLDSSINNYEYLLEKHNNYFDKIFN